jgi:hypothetical protein
MERLGFSGHQSLSGLARTLLAATLPLLEAVPLLNCWLDERYGSADVSEIGRSTEGNKLTRPLANQSRSCGPTAKYTRFRQPSTVLFTVSGVCLP